MERTPELSNASAVVFLLRQTRMRQVVSLILMMGGVSLTEGFGVLMLVPVLGGLQGGGTGAGWAHRLETVIGFMPSTTALLGAMVALAAIRAVLIYAQRVTSMGVQYDVVDTLRKRAFDEVLHAEWRWLVQTRASDHANLLLSQVSYAGQGLNQLIAMTGLGIATLGYLAAAFLLSWNVALMTIALGALVLVAFRSHRRRAAHLGQAMNRASKRLSGYMLEGFGGIRIVKAYAAEAAQVRRYADTLAEARAQDLRQEQLGAIGQGLLQVGGAAALALILGIGYVGWHVPMATLLPLLLIFARLTPMLSALQSGWSVWAFARPALAEMRAFFEETGAAREPQGDVSGPPMRVTQAIELQDIGVRYAGRDALALDGVSLTLPANTTTALCGASGAGKSTLADVVMGLIVADRGRLLVDGAVIEDDARIAWRRAVAYVQQDAFLFHDTIRANILVGRDGISTDDVEQALHRARATFVLDLPAGLDTVVGDGGVRLSGGERQRVALARALVGSPSLVILDEATSALDPETEIEVRRTMQALRGHVTLLFISHRESMREDADQVVVLNHGRICAPEPCIGLPG